MESLDCLVFDLLVPDHVNGFLSTAEQDIHDLFCLYRVKAEPENVLDDMLIHVIKASRSMKALVFHAVVAAPIGIPPLCYSHSCISRAADCKFRI